MKFREAGVFSWGHAAGEGQNWDITLSVLQGDPSLCLLGDAIMLVFSLGLLVIKYSLVTFKVLGIVLGSFRTAANAMRPLHT